MNLRTLRGIWTCLALGACSSGGTTTTQASCPGEAPISCSDDQGTWCCPIDADCGDVHGRCAQSCPAATPVSCGQSGTDILCCPEPTRCGPNNTCLPLDSQASGGGGTSSAGGAGGTAGSSLGTSGTAGSGGSISFGQACKTSSDCPSDTPCCGDLSDHPVCVAAGYVSTGLVACRCTVSAECSSGACAPKVDSDGAPVGPYVCVPNDDGAYHGCSKALSSCASGFCCFTDENANEFCSEPCTSNSQCGAASCNTYSGAHTLCGGTLGCGPS
jgi:hypothetical protein